MAILYTIYPRTFLMSPLHSLSLKMWILVYYMPYFRHFGSSFMCYCVDGGHLGRHLEFNPFCPWSRLSTQVFFTYLGVHYQDQESKWGDIWLHTGPPPSAPGLRGQNKKFEDMPRTYDRGWGQFDEAEDIILSSRPACPSLHEWDLYIPPAGHDHEHMRICNSAFICCFVTC